MIRTLEDKCSYDSKQTATPKAKPFAARKVYDCVIKQDCITLRSALQKRLEHNRKVIHTGLRCCARNVQANCIWTRVQKHIMLFFPLKYVITVYLVGADKLTLCKYWCNARKYSIRLTDIFFFLFANGSTAQKGLGLIVQASRSHPDTPHSVDEWSARHRDLYLTTHNTHKRQTGIRTHNPSNRATTDPRLRPHGHWDRNQPELQSVESKEIDAT